ncbi:hypothetical protein LX73_0542 [Fodinibius salinus]|uniref:Uncharacterized protein n=1 Tax=Fodinibius salinus TaxID=860790 RepID=A0A5D3YM65_9BACT|nr:hypothetical protein LX73_0542 [Fodinibius salinus]
MSSKNSVNKKFSSWFSVGCMFETLGILENPILSSVFGIEIPKYLPIIFIVIGIACIVISMKYLK